MTIQLRGCLAVLLLHIPCGAAELSPKPCGPEAEAAMPSCGELYAKVRDRSGGLGQCNLISADTGIFTWQVLDGSAPRDCRDACDEIAPHYLRNGRAVLCCSGRDEGSIERYYPGARDCRYCLDPGQYLASFTKDGRAICRNVCELVPAGSFPPGYPPRMFEHVGGAPACLAYCEGLGPGLWSADRLCSRCVYNGLEPIRSYPEPWPPECAGQAVEVLKAEQAGTFEFRSDMPVTVYHMVSRYEASPVGSTPEDRVISVPKGIRWAVEPKEVRLSLDDYSGLAGVLRSNHVPALRLMSSQNTNAGLARLAGLEGLVWLNMLNSDMGDEGLAHVAKLPDLEDLELCGVSGRITDAGVRSLAALKKLKALSLCNTAVTDAGLEILTGLQSLKELHFIAGVTDTGMACLAAMTGLEELDLAFGNMSDEGVRKLKPLRRLRKLSLGLTRVTGSGFADLSGRELRELKLNDCPIADAALPYIARFKKLEDLDLDKTLVTDAGLPRLKGLAALRTLNLRRTAVSDAGLAALSELRSLETLNLEGTAVTDRGLKKLAVLPRLAVLDLSDTKVTDACVPAVMSMPALKELRVRGTGVSQSTITNLVRWKKMQVSY